MKKRSIRKLAATLLITMLLLGIRDGYMALWKLDDPEPLHIFPFRASIFPEKIRSALEKGIRIEQDSDVGRLLLDMIP